MGRLMDIALRFFEEERWQADFLGDESTLAAAYLGDSGEYRCVLHVRDRAEQILFYAHFPVLIPPERRSAVGEYITRANQGMYLGNFELDMEDGEVRYKTSADVEGVDITPLFVRNLVYPCLSTMDRYAPGIQKVVTDQASPAEAIRDVEEG